MKSNLPELNDLRGMGEPHFFSFSLDPKTKVMTSHGLVFLSVVKAPHQSIELLQLEDDPRCPHLVKYVGENFFKENANNMIADLEKQLASAKQMIARLQGIIDKESKSP